MATRETSHPEYDDFADLLFKVIRWLLRKLKRIPIEFWQRCQPC